MANGPKIPRSEQCTLCCATGLIEDVAGNKYVCGSCGGTGRKENST